MITVQAGALTAQEMLFLRRAEAVMKIRAFMIISVLLLAVFPFQPAVLARIIHSFEICP
jgi:hypothetical protein